MRLVELFLGEVWKRMALYKNCVRDWDAANEEKTSVAKAKERHQEMKRDRYGERIQK